jgi:hypothetical protein
MTPEKSQDRPEDVTTDSSKALGEAAVDGIASRSWSEEPSPGDRSSSALTYISDADSEKPVGEDEAMGKPRTVPQKSLAASRSPLPPGTTHTAYSFNLPPREDLLLMQIRKAKRLGLLADRSATEDQAPTK